MTQKTCSGCKEIKPLESFPNNKSMPDGKQIYCRVCWNQRNKLYMARKRNGVKDNIQRIVAWRCLDCDKLHISKQQAQTCNCKGDTK